MIPAGLAAVQAAFSAWKAAGIPNLDAFDDEELRDTYRALAALLRDVEHAHGDARALLLRRVMATKGPAR